jgi:hypothetical protein
MTETRWCRVVQENGEYLFFSARMCGLREIPAPSAPICTTSPPAHHRGIRDESARDQPGLF